MNITKAALVKAQLANWPDSKMVSIGDALKWIAESYEPNAYDEKAIADYCDNFKGCDNTPAERRQTKRDAIASNERTRIERSRSVAQSIAVALANAVEAGTPVQFYLCGFDAKSNTYRYRGCRYGIEGSEYMSGFGFF